MQPLFASLDAVLLPAHVAAIHLHGGNRTLARFRRLPGPFAAVVAHVGEPGWWRPAGEPRWRPYPRVALHGPFTMWSEALEGRDQRCVIALIEPWSVRPLLGLAPGATIGSVLDLEEGNSSLAAALAVAAAGDDPLPAFAALLGDRLSGRQADEIVDIVARVRHRAGGPGIAAEASRSGRSERGLRRLFHERTGLSPKRWCSLERFAANLRRLHPAPWGRPGPPPDYFDQPHEIREFRAFAGITPGAYRREKLAGDRRVFAFG